MTDTTGIRIHSFRTTKEAYNKSQTGYYEYPEGEEAYIEVKDGDVLLIPEEGVVGIMNDAWPVAFTEKRGEFHHPNGEPGWNHLTNRYAGWTMNTVAKFVAKYELRMVNIDKLPYTKPAPKRCAHLYEVGGPHEGCAEFTPNESHVFGCNTIVAESETFCGDHKKEYKKLLVVSIEVPADYDPWEVTTDLQNWINKSKAYSDTTIMGFEVKED